MNALPTGDGHDRHLVDFAEALRALRQRASHPSLAEMSRRSGVCIASLSGAHNGRTLPTWRTVEGYVRACGADPERWRSRWENLRLTQHTDTGDKHAAVLKEMGSHRPAHSTPVGQERGRAGPAPGSHAPLPRAEPARPCTPPGRLLPPHLRRRSSR
ncbi:helix-turn-helix domain-containing protein [Streptomyces sp. GS7]|uniref:helix-turn-helix domain-containing protein n=1 Tax=Streptomyces sp. GS7 TaxID=2692234 RepID=UPI0022A864C7|nr:helix-turn-helix transcriptional regulator [Streptomyces sp. GS7]